MGKISRASAAPQMAGRKPRATVPGWTRSSVAEEMLRRLREKEVVAEQATSTEFSAFLKNKGPAFANLTQEQRESIFRDFLLWQKQRNRSQP